MVTFNVDKDAFLLRDNGRVDRGGASGALTVLRLVSGALLSVSGSRAKTLETKETTIGIRGIGTYLERQAQPIYFCCCYGEVDISAVGNDAPRKRISTRHHEAPRYILSAGYPNITIAPVSIIATLSWCNSSR